MILSSCITTDYLPRAKRFLETVHHFPNNNIIIIERDRLPSSHSFGIIQHGAFLDFLPPIDEPIIFTDADITIQRPINKWEENVVNTIGDKIGMYPNTVGDTLRVESSRIGLHDWDCKFLDNTCYNTGVLVANPHIFRKLQKEYETLCDQFYLCSSHRSRCQFLINECVYRLQIPIVELPDLFHQNGHFGMPQYCTAKNGIIYRNNARVLFAHAFQSH